MDLGKRFFHNLFNERGETLNAEEKPDTELVEGEEKKPNEPAEQQINWEDDSNPYKKRYSDSQSQITPLVRTLNGFAEYDHNSKTWRPKSSVPQNQPEDIDKVLEGYDPDFRKSLGTYVSRQIKEGISNFQKESSAVAEYSSGVTAARAKAIEEFGDEFEFAKNGKFNAESLLYKLANEILTSKYAQFNPDGTFYRYTSPESEYMATVEAYAIISKRAKQQPNQDKGKFGAIQGKGTKASGVRKALSYEEYSKLSTDAKDAYDLQQSGN